MAKSHDGEQFSRVSLRHLSVAIILIIILLAAAFLYRALLKGFNHHPVGFTQKNEKFERLLAKEKTLIQEDFEHKYHKDIDSYRALADKIQLEKQKVKLLEEKLAVKNR